MDRDPQNGAPDGLSVPQGGQWLPINVPGDLNAALVKHGRMPDPQYDVQARQCYWVSAREWWFARTFDAPAGEKGEAEIVFEGIDGTADLFLNGTFLGTTRNAFRPRRFTVTRLLKEKENRLLLRFQSIDKLMGGPRFSDMLGWKGRRAFLRKPQYCFGWDWAVPLPSLGLCGGVSLEVGLEKRFVDFSIQTFNSGRIDLAFEVSRAAKEAGYQVQIAIKGQGARLNHRLKGLEFAPYSGHGADGSGKASTRYKSYVSLNVPNPELWFPLQSGGQPLYEYEFKLVAGGRVCDSRSGRFAFREIAAVEEPFRKEAGPGFSFGVSVNGKRIFCKGANMAPFALWPAAADFETKAWYLEKVKEAGFNMIRIWGGGVYEEDRFYNLCDELGIMVWQDFMFASTGYPLDLLREEILPEAEHQVKRLRHHPCIAIWCGCNEDVNSWRYPGETKPSVQEDTGNYSAADEVWKVNRHRFDPELYGFLLRGVAGRYAPGVPYVESSPASRDDSGNIPSSGNCHVSSWKYALIQSKGHPETFRRHFEQVCSFDSEFCIQGPCSVRMVKSFLKPENHWPPNEAWTFHIQKGHLDLPHHEQTLRIAGGIFGPIDSLQKYVKFGQATHAEMMRCEFESARRDFPDNGGTMVWMFNDCWPTCNWSIIDFDRRPKPSYYAAKRACAPLLPVIMERKGRVEFFFSNNSPEPARVTFEYGAENLLGLKSWSKKKRLTVAGNSTVKVDALPRTRQLLKPDEFYYIRVKGLPVVAYFPDGWKDVFWPEPGLRVEKTGEKRFRISTRYYARFAHLLFNGPGNAWFSDNYFDLPAGESRETTVTSDRSLSTSDLTLGHWNTEWE